MGILRTHKSTSSQVEHCTGIAEVMGSNPFGPAEIVNTFEALISQLLKIDVDNCDNHVFIRSLNRNGKYYESANTQLEMFT